MTRVPTSRNGPVARAISLSLNGLLSPATVSGKRVTFRPISTATDSRPSASRRAFGMAMRTATWRRNEERSSSFDASKSTRLPSLRTPTSRTLPVSAILYRMGTPEEVAACVFRLCTSDFSYVTGTEIFVTGGQHVY
ncbi:MAG: SDR family oxidoreductase [Rhodospirillaceae bacterium]|nr:SDR family oxidoreductase [Rhodospirillaceae bacterium]MBT5667701.1 SDR family oxidoreductase [Rhodospirillaceae bacterium]